MIKNNDDSEDDFFMDDDADHLKPSVSSYSTYSIEANPDLKKLQKQIYREGFVAGKVEGVTAKTQSHFNDGFSQVNFHSTHINNLST